MKVWKRRMFWMWKFLMNSWWIKVMYVGDKGERKVYLGDEMDGW